MISPVKIWRNQKRMAGLIGKTGTIATWTIIRVPPGDFMNQAPYPVVVVAFVGGRRMTCQLVDWEEKHLVTGQKVVTIVRKVFETGDGVIPYGIKVKPL